MGKKNLKKYDPAFKARVALEAAKEQESLAQIGHRHGVPIGVSNAVSSQVSGVARCVERAWGPMGGRGQLKRHRAGVVLRSGPGAAFPRALVCAQRGFQAGSKTQ